MRFVSLAVLACTVLPLAAQTRTTQASQDQTHPTLTGQAAFHDYSQEKPGVRRKITAADLPAPDAAESVDNGPHLVPRPNDAWPIAPAGFKVTLYAGGDAPPMLRSENRKETHAATQGTFVEPRLIRTAPNGDVFLADSQAGIVYILRGLRPDGRAAQIEPYVTGLDHPFGIAFYPADNPKFVYVANTTSVVRFPYTKGDLRASAGPENIVETLPGYAQLRGGGHWTRDVVFTRDGQHMLVSVGSGSNIDDPDTHPREFHRADVLEYTPQGKFEKVYASGLRNCVGEAINPITGSLWCSTNERDVLGNNLVPDYVTSVKEGGFYGWPFYYMGAHRDPRLPEPCANGTAADLQAPALTADQAQSCKHVDLAQKVITPDVLLQAHFASLEMLFYPAQGSFPAQFDRDGFAAEHGSWNRSKRTGYEVIRIPMHNGQAEGSYEDFLTGFVLPSGDVWGRPVGVAIAADGSMLVTDDGSRSVWRVAYTGKH